MDQNSIELMSNILFLEQMSKKAKEKYNSLSDYERYEYNRVKDLNAKIVLFNDTLSKGICPNCESKLKRKGKNKNKDYRREWKWDIHIIITYQNTLKNKLLIEL